jgi:predicted Zn-dependent protease with MMP-like domain|tara:strand:+ start:254 stop:622 length:369 start_codon:yes stop_codon:yes gene_type:complete
LINITNREFVRLVRQAYREIPNHIIQALDNVDVVVEEWPGPEEEDLINGEGSLFGLYHGVPLTEREGGDPMLPNRIAIYRQPILRSCSSRTEAEHEIKVTLWHEIGHYLGMSEDDLHRLGYG